MSHETERYDPVAAFSAFGRTAYGEAVSVVTLSLCFTLAVLPVVTVVPATFALVTVVTCAVTDETVGEKTTERERLRLFWRTFRAELRQGLPLGLLAVAALLAEVLYLRWAFSTGSGVALVGSAVGVYALCFGVVWTLRAGSLRARGAPSPIRAYRDAGDHLLEAPSFTALSALLVGVVVVLCGVVGIALPLLCPGLLAVLEVVGYEERSGVGAGAVVRAYQGGSP